MSKIGVYFCHCNRNGTERIDIDQLMKTAEEMESVFVVNNDVKTCTLAGIQAIREDIKSKGLDKIVVLSNSPEMHQSILDKLLQEEGVRHHCVNPLSFFVSDNGETPSFDGEQFKNALASLDQTSTAQFSSESVTQGTLVVGAGIAGIQAALDIADAGFQVYLVEKEPSIGGHMAQLDKTFPTLDCSACILTPKMVDVGNHPNIELLTYSEVEKIAGSAGNYTATILKHPRFVDLDKCTGCGLCAEDCRLKGRIPSEFDAAMGNRSAVYVPFPQAVPLKYTVDETKCLFLTRGKCGKEPACQVVCPSDAIDFTMKEERIQREIGTIIVATGFDPFEPTQKPELAHANYPNVITGLELERLIAASGPTAGKIQIDEKVPQKVVFIQCVGSRDKNLGNEWCSRVCCMYAIKQAHLVKEKIPDALVTVLYMDLRCFGKGFEEFYDRVREEGVIFRRAIGSEIYRKGDGLAVRAEDTLLGETIELAADLVVLSAGLTPGEGSNQIAELLNIQKTADGFLMESHPKLFPVDTTDQGVFLAGCCQGPKDIPDTVAQGKAAASSAMTLMRRPMIKETDQQPTEIHSDANL